MITRLALLLLLLPASADAGQLIEVEPGGTYEVSASANDLTAIGMADGLRLQAIFGMETVVSISKDEAFGRAIIKPVSRRPFSLIVTDENGDSYSLEVTPVDGPGQVITLKRRSHQANEALIKAEREMPFMSRLKRNLKLIAGGTLPAGYTVEQRNQTVPLWVEADFRLLRVYQGGLRIEHYLLRNISATEMRLDEREFKVLSRVVAVAIKTQVLAPQAATDIFIIRGSNDVEQAARGRT